MTTFKDLNYNTMCFQSKPSKVVQFVTCVMKALVMSLITTCQNFTIPQLCGGRTGGTEIQILSKIKLKLNLQQYYTNAFCIEIDNIITL